MMTSWQKITLAIAASAAFMLSAQAESPQKMAKPATNTASAIFAGGCFWCSESDFEKLKGVKDAVSGYIGGHVNNPSYEQVSGGDTGHYEAVEVFYDPSVISYDALVTYFWSHHNYLDGGGQFCDRGQQYAPAIFPKGAEQLAIATKSLAAFQQRVTGKIATKIIPATRFYNAEGYHQNYYKNNSLRYQYYRLSCGRDSRIEALKANLK